MQDVREAKRALRAGGLSIALHAGAAALLIVLTARSVPTPDPPPAPIAVDIIVPPPPPAPSGPIGRDTQPAPLGHAAPLGFHGHQALRSAMRAPRRAADPMAELTVSFDTPAGSDADGPPGESGDSTGLGVAGTGGTGRGMSDVPGLAIPPPPTPATGPRPRYDYSEARLRGSRSYWGKTLRVDIEVGADGQVLSQRVVNGIEYHLDMRAMLYARQFEFEPARDTAGHAIRGHYTWTFVVDLL